MKFCKSEALEEYLENLFAMFEESLDASEFFNEYLSLETKQKRKVDLPAKKLDPKSYLSSPYWNVCAFFKGKKGNVEIGFDSYKSGERFLYKEISAEPNEFYREINPYGYFEKDFSFPCIKKNGTIWMSLIPHEIHTMEEAVKKAHGRVMTLGLGMGYYAYMISEKKEVTSVDIIDNDPSVISLFKNYILPHFPHKEKIRIIQGDAYKALENEKTKPHDYVYVDIYHNEEDGLPCYLKGKGIIDSDHIDYWIEGSILVYYRRALISLIQEEHEGSTDEDYSPSKEYFLDDLFYRLHEKLKEVELKSPKDVKNLLSEQNLKTLL